MYRQDSKLEIADIKLRLFVAYCNDLPRVIAEVKDINSKLSSLHKTGSIIRLDKHANSNYETTLLTLINKKSAIVGRYSEYMSLIRSVRPVIMSLDPKDIKLLSERYEKKKTLREIGNETNYSYMNVSRRLDDILWRFA